MSETISQEDRLLTSFSSNCCVPRLTELMQEVAPGEVLDPDVQDVSLTFSTKFGECGVVLTFLCNIAPRSFSFCKSMSMNLLRA